MKSYIVCCILFLVTVTASGQNVSELYSRETLQTSDGETLNYRKLSPQTLEEGMKYPLVIFLHGAGERGSDNERQLTHGADLFAKTANRSAYPAYVLFPQCPDKYFWPFKSNPPNYTASTFPVNYTVAPAIKQVKELIDLYLQMDEIDKDRVYIVGISMGGMGTFDIVCRYPDTFAAAIPICGGVNTARLTEDVGNIYWRIFHGDADGIVPVKNSRDAYSALLTTGADVEYIEIPGVDHESWKPAFNREDFLPWLFSKTRKSVASTININKEEPEVSVFQCNRKLYIEVYCPGVLQVNLYNTSGSRVHVFPEVQLNNCFQKEYSLYDIDNGTYLAEIKIGEISRILKVIL